MQFVNIAKILFLYSIRYLVPYLPHRFMAAIADATGIASRRSRQTRIIKEELRKLFGDEKPVSELDHIALESICNYRKDLFEIWSFPHLNAKRIAKFAYLEGREHLDKALENGKGVVVAVSHFGSWKMITAVLAYEGYKVNQIGIDPRYFIGEDRAHHHNVIMEIEHRCDESLPANFIYLGGQIREAYRALARNELVLNSIDGFIGTKWVEMPFLNGKIRLSLGPIVMAASSSAAFLPTFTVRQSDNRYKVTVHEEIQLEKDIPRDEAVRRATEVYAKIFEDYVSRYPSHYCRRLYDGVTNPQRLVRIQT